MVSEKIATFAENIVSRMIRHLLFSTLATAVLGLVPVSAGAMSVSSPVVEAALQQDTDVSISYSEGVLYVNGAENRQLEIVSLTGKRVSQSHIDSPAQKIELSLPKGCYIVKIGDVVRKISVR